MAVVAFIFESDQVGQADYDGLMQAIGRESLDAPTPDGFIAHLSGPKPSGGWQAIDVWESEAAANAFYQSEQFAPVRAGADSIGMRTTPWPSTGPRSTRRSSKSANLKPLRRNPDHPGHATLLSSIGL